MSPHFPSKINSQLLLLFLYVWLIYSSSHAISRINNSNIQCLDNEREALLQFKQGIRVDRCGFLDSWGNTQDCCQWHGIRCNNHSGHVINLDLPGPLDYRSYESCLEGTLGVSLLELKLLKYLDLSFNYFGGQLPKFIGSLANLENLKLSNAGFTGVIPQEIGNLSRLISFDLHDYYHHSNMRVESLRWLLQLRLLREVDLSGIDLSVATNNWLSILNNLPFLQKLRLDKCGLSLNSPPTLSYINSSSTLGFLSLRDNNLNDTSIFEWLLNLSGLDTSLTYLDLSWNQIFGNNLQLSGRAVKFIGNLCSLQTLNLIGTNLYYDFSDIVQSFSPCPHKALAFLYLRDNGVWGSTSDNIDSFSSFRELDVEYNQLNGSISQALGQLSRLEVLDLASNSLTGVHTITYFESFQVKFVKLDR